MNAVKEYKAGERIRQPSYHLDPTRRQVVLAAIQEVCSHKGWLLVAAHVRSNHVHAVVDTDQSAEHVMNAFKAYASRALNRNALDRPDRRRWARHGSTRPLWIEEAVTAAVHYVVCEQGEAMAVWSCGR